MELNVLIACTGSVATIKLSEIIDQFTKVENIKFNVNKSKFYLLSFLLN